MAGREVREYTNLTDPKGIFNFYQLSFLFILCFYGLYCGKFWFLMNFCYWVCVNFTDKKLDKGKNKIDDEDVIFQHMFAG